MLSRGPRRLLELSLRAASTTSRMAVSSTSRSTASRRLRPSRCFRSVSSAVASHHPHASSVSRSLQLRSFSHVTSSTPPVPQDEYEELKSFLAEPTTAGAASERAKDIVAGWMQRHVDPAMPGQDATVMVMVADAMEDPQFVLQVYSCLRDAGVSPSPITLEYSAAACAQLGQWRTALEIIEFMHQAVEIMQPSLDIYENAIAACHKDKKWMRSKHLLEEMRTYGLEASPELHVASIRLCIDSNEATATRVLLDAFMRACDEELEEEEKLKILTDLFHAATDAQSLPQALFFRDELLARNFAVSKELYTRLIHLCAVKRQWHKARVLLQQFVDINAPPPKALPSNRHLDHIHRLLKEMHAHDIEIPLAVYNAGLRHFGQVSLLNDAKLIYADMQKSGVIPDATSFAALMCSSGPNIQQSETYFRQLQRDNCEPTLDAVHAYLLVPSRANQWDEVLKRYTTVHDEDPLFKDLPMESDVRIQSLVAVAYGRTQRPEQMLRVFTAMKVKGMEPNLHVYGEALFAYIRQDQWRHALMLFDHLFQQQTPEMQEKRVLEKFPMLWDAAVLACVQGEQDQRAAMLYDTIIEQRVPISMGTGEHLAALLTSVPAETLWRSFKPISSLHRTKTRSRMNPRVQNAVLKRAVDENDSNLAEQIVAEGMQMELLPNSMTYALMLRLYTSQEDQESFHNWWRRMEVANVKTTLFVFRALMQHLSLLSVDCEDVAYLHTIGSFLQRKHAGGSNASTTTVGNTKEYAAELGRTALDIMEGRRMAPDTICLQYYLLLSQEPDHVGRALAFVEEALSSASGSDQDTLQDVVQLTPRLLHTLFTALGNYPDDQRARKLLIDIVKCLPSDLSENAVAAYCAANDSYHTLQLLSELLDEKCPLKDEHVLFFLTNSYTCEASSLETEKSRPRSGNGVIVDMAALLCESETVAMEVGCLAFLIEHVVELSKWQQLETFEVSTQGEIEAMKKLLVRAFSHFSINQVTEFLSKVIDRDDLVHIASVLDELQGIRDNH